MNYVTHTRIAFARLSAEPTATAQHVSLYVALFQKWNNAHFPVSIMLMRDELMAAAHIGSRATYLSCLRDLDKWKFLAYLPSQSPHKASRAIMYEQTSLEIKADSAYPSTMLENELSSGPSGGLSGEQVVGQAVGPITKTSANEANLANEVNAASAGAENRSFSSTSAEYSKADSSSTPRNEVKEKVAPKRKVRTPTPAPDRPAKRPEVPFAESELADLSSFIAAFTGTDFELANLRYYHEKVATWRKDGEPPRRRDWKATAKTFMLNDVERNALVLAPGTHRGSAGASSFPNQSTAHAAEYVSQRYA